MMGKSHSNIFDLNREDKNTWESGAWRGAEDTNPELLLHIQEGNLSSAQVGKQAGSRAKSNTHTLSATEGRVREFSNGLRMSRQEKNYTRQQSPAKNRHK